MEAARATAFGAACVTVAGLLAASAVGAEGSKVNEFRLGNGMRGVVIEDRRAPVVTHMVWYPVGGADDPAGRSGLAHFLEHMMFKGTERLSGEGFTRKVAENGGQSNAFTSYDYTAYYERVARDRLGLVMELEADRMAGITLGPEAIGSERNVVIEERNERIDVNPDALFSERMGAALYLNHPYGRPLIGWRGEIEAIEREDLVAFHRRHYAPDRALLVVVGDVSAEEVERLAEDAYGGLPAAGIALAARPAEPPHRAARRIRMEDPRAVKPNFRRDYLVPSRHSAGAEEAAALAVFTGVLGDGPDSRLGQALVETGRAHVAGAYYRGSLRDYGSVILVAVPADGISLEEIEADIDREIQKLATEGPTQDELARIKTLVLAGEIYRLDSQFGLARRYGAALTNGETVAEVQAWSEKIEAVSAAEVIRAAQEHLRLESSVTGYLLSPTGPG